MSETDLKSPTVLVLEDNEDSRYVRRPALEGLGYRVCEAENGEKQLQLRIVNGPTQF